VALIPEDDNHHSHRRGNLKSYTPVTSFLFAQKGYDHVVTAQLYVLVFLSAQYHSPYVHSITERKNSSTYSKCSGNVQADHHSHHPSLSYF
jgi:hypothetical protein